MTISRNKHAVKLESSVKKVSYNRRYSVNLHRRGVFLQQRYSLVLLVSVWWEITFTLKYSVISYFILGARRSAVG